MAKELKEIRARVAARREELFDATLRVERARRQVEITTAQIEMDKAEYNEAVIARRALLSNIEAEESTAIMKLVDGERALNAEASPAIR